MPQYRVRVIEKYSVDIVVEADHEDQAREKANKLVWHGDLPKSEYHSTTDANDWDVEAV